MSKKEHRVGCYMFFFFRLLLLFVPFSFSSAFISLRVPQSPLSSLCATTVHRTVVAFQLWCDGWRGDCWLPARPLVIQVSKSVETQPGVWWHLAFYSKIMHQCWHSVLCIKFIMYVALPVGAAAEREEWCRSWGADTQTFSRVELIYNSLSLIKLNVHTS